MIFFLIKLQYDSVMICSKNTPQDEHVFTIAEFTRMVRGLLEAHFSTIWIEGEISNFACPRSGHWYFSLKDETAQIRCAMFQSNHRHIKFQPEDGMHVLVRAKTTLYEARGDFQLVISHLEEKGMGALQRAFEQLKQKLEKLGLFDEKHKKTIPDFPNCVGIITSPTGAAIRDILTVLKRRFPTLPIVIYPTLVQGDKAASQIVNAIQMANERNECDVLLLSRGGGSLEDLWPFNEEIVAHAIFNSQIPIVSGIGHEIDFTISDFVADMRAPTPSAAAEIISPNQTEILNQLEKHQHYLTRTLIQKLGQTQLLFTGLKKRLTQCHPIVQIEQQVQHYDQCEQRLIKAQKNQFQHYHYRLQLLGRALNAVNPLATLGRGFAIVTNHLNKIITDEKQLNPNEIITTQLAKGKIRSIVKK